jgi:hypothetical protein
MAQIHLDFSNIEEFDPLPKGDYPVVIESAQVRESKENPGTEYLNWELTVTDGEFEGRKLFMSNGLTEKSLYYLHQQFLDIGVIDEDAVEMDLEVDEETGYLIEPEVAGIAAIATVGTQVRKGKIQNTVDRLALEEEEVFEPAPKKGATKAPAGKVATKNKGPKFR